MNRIAISFDMTRITIAIAVGVALVIGAFMYGATKPLTNQAFAAATPCDLTIGTPLDEQFPDSVIGKLTCGGHGVPDETIKFSGLPQGSDTGRTSNDGNYENPALFSADKVYTVTVTFDGDSTLNLGPASATTTVGFTGSAGATHGSNNARILQNNTNGGTPQEGGGNNTQQ